MVLVSSSIDTRRAFNADYTATSWDRESSGVLRFNLGRVWGTFGSSRDGRVLGLIQGGHDPKTALVAFYPDETKLVELARGYGKIRSACISADGKHAAFASRCERDSEVYTVNIETRVIENITRSYEDETDSQLSAVGSRLLVRRGDAVLVLDRASGEWTTVVESEPEQSAVLSPAGDQVAYLERNEDGKLSAKIVDV